MWVLQRSNILFHKSVDNMMEDELACFSFLRTCMSYKHYCGLKTIADLNSLERKGKI